MKVIFFFNLVSLNLENSQKQHFLQNDDAK